MAITSPNLYSVEFTQVQDIGGGKQKNPPPTRWPMGDNGKLMGV